jgi:hypothetical protein
MSCGCGCGCESCQRCDCCQGVHTITPEQIDNRPGLPELHYRVGTHGSFLETMKARLSSQDFPALARLTSRESNDASIALLDAWATVGDVLSFYTERIANESYLRTATERRSVLELARLVGYAPRPGVASSVFLAYTLEDGHEDVTVAKGTRAQSVPGPGELPQSFETSDALMAHSKLSALKPRLSRPARLVLPALGGSSSSVVSLKGSPSDFQKGELLLVTYKKRPVAQNSVTALFEVLGAVATSVSNHVRLELKFVQADGVDTPPPSATSILFQSKQQLRSIIEDINTDPKIEGIATAEKFFLEKTLLENLRSILNTNLVPSLLLEKIRLNYNIKRGVVRDWLRQVIASLERIDSIQQGLSPAMVNLQSFLTAISNQSHPFFSFAQADFQGPSIVARFTAILNSPQPKPTRDLLLLLKAAHRTASTPVVLNGLNESVEVLESLLNLIDPQIGNAPVVTSSFDRQTFFDAVRAKNSLQPASQFQFERGVQLFQSNMNASFALFKAQNPAYAIAFQVLGQTANTAELEVEKIERFRVKAGLFGRNAPSIPIAQGSQIVAYLDPFYSRYYFQPTSTASIPSTGGLLPAVPAPPALTFQQHTQHILSDTASIPSFADQRHLVLDQSFEKVKSGDTVVIRYFDPKNPQIQISSIMSHTAATIRKYGMAVQSTILQLNADFNPEGWTDQATPQQPLGLKIKDILTRTTVYTGTETLELANEPISVSTLGTTAQPVVGLHDITPGEDPAFLELDGVFYGLEAGRWVIFQGERIDLLPAIGGQPVPSGVIDAELAMIAEVKHRFAKTELGTDWPGDTMHTFIKFAAPLKWKFKRDTVVIFANVVKATHGETRREVLGAGDASVAFQRFDLKQPPLTYLPSATAAGAQSTLEVRVNEVRWNETPFLAGLEANDRGYEIRIEDDGQTSVIFGDGVRGSRLPTGRENITALYRNGIGKPGNVTANKISLLANKPFGVRSVINPIRASGGADRETRDQARRNAPLAVMALDRLVGVRDYEDFARTFAGIAKASATRVALSERSTVHVTVAGLDDIPIDESSDLYRNLLEAFRRLGDPDLPVVLAVRDPLFLVVKAKVRVGAAYLWELVEPKIRAAMLKYFGFDARELGQDAISSEVLSVIQAVPGVEYVDLDHFGSISQDSLLNPTSIATFVATDARVEAKLAALDPIAMGLPTFNPAQIAYLTPTVADTLLLSEIK